MGGMIEEIIFWAALLFVSLPPLAIMACLRPSFLPAFVESAGDFSGLEAVGHIAVTAMWSAIISKCSSK